MAIGMTIPEAARRYNLDAAAVQRLRTRLKKHAIDRRGRGHIVHYPTDALLDAVKAISGPLGGFPPSTDLHYCRCGRMWIDAEALDGHIQRDHGGRAPDRASSELVESA